MSKHERTIVGLLLAGLGTCVIAMGGCDSAGETKILDVTPRVGSVSGEQSVQILGQNFRQDIGYTIYFGTKKTASVTIRDPETIEVVTPSGMPEGTVDIMIRADDGNAYRIADVFKFLPTPGASGGPTPEQKAKGNLAY